jgi:hypothetical protein
MHCHSRGQLIGCMPGQQAARRSREQEALTLRRCSAFSTITSRARSPFSAPMACRALSPLSPARRTLCQ